MAAVIVLGQAKPNVELKSQSSKTSSHKIIRSI